MKTSKTARRVTTVLLAGTVVVGATAACTSDSGTADGTTSTSATSFDYSEGLDENGFWAGVTALDLVTLPAYTGIEIPAESHTVADEDVQSQIDSLLTGYATQEQVTDRAIEDGDTVNLDYVGTVDGEEFEGGSTDGAGTDVTAGSTDFIDDFLTQIIGHLPGDSFDVEVTFPDDYSETALAGKDAVFATTINYIVNEVTPDLTDDFVAENLTDSYGWTTVAEMTAAIRDDLQHTAVEDYLYTYLTDEAEISEVPDSVREAYEGSLVDYYASQAASFGMELADYLSAYVGVTDEAALIEQNAESLTSQSNYALVIQAIAEDTGVTVSDDDVADYFEENMGSADYSTYESQYGLPYLKVVVLSETVMDQVIADAVLL
jgi:trigger factor